MITDITLPSAQQVIAQIHSDNPASQDVISLAVVDLTNVTELVADPSGKNTALTVTAKLNVGHKGSRVFRYNRNPLSAFMDVFNLGDPIELLVEEGDDATDIIDRFNMHFASNLQIGQDINSFSVPELDYDGKMVTIETLPTSYAWTGSLAFTVMMESYPLSNFIVNTDIGFLSLTDTISIEDEVLVTDLGGFKYSYSLTTPPTVPIGAQYTYGIDFTTQYNVLNVLAQGTILSVAQGTTLVNAALYCDLDGGQRLQWKSVVSLSGNGPFFNLEGGTIVYNGLNDNPNKPTNKAFKYVMEIQPKAGVTSPIGNLYFHYNIPINPLAAANPNA